MSDKKEAPETSHSDKRHEDIGSKPADRSKAKRVIHQVREGGVATGKKPASVKNDKPNEEA